MHHRAVGADAVDDAAGGGAADRLDAELDRRVAGLAGDAGGEIVAVDDHQVGAKLLQLGGQLGPAHDIDGAQAALMGQHDQQPADRGVGDVLDDPVAALEVDEVRQHELRGRRVDAHHRRLPEVDAGRQRDGVVALDLAASAPSSRAAG